VLVDDLVTNFSQSRGGVVMRNSSWFEGQLHLEHVCLRGALGVHGEGIDVTSYELADSFTLFGCKTLMRVDLDGVEKGNLLGAEPSNPVTVGVVVSGRPRVATYVVLGIDQCEWRSSCDGMRRTASVNDLDLDLPVLDGGASGYNLRWLLEASTIRQTVDEAGRVLTFADEVEQSLWRADEGGHDRPRR